MALTRSSGFLLLNLDLPNLPARNHELSGLTKGLRLVRGLRRQLDEADRNSVAEAIREHLKLAGWRIEPGPAIGGHSQLSGRAAKRDGS